MRRYILITVLLPIFLVIPAAKAENQRATEAFMRKKLDYASGILEGLTLDKFDLVTTNATLLRSMDVTNAFAALGNPDYRRAVKSFQSNTDDLIKAAAKKESEKSTKAYLRVARNCVDCHQQFRHEQFVESQKALLR